MALLLRRRTLLALMTLSRKYRFAVIVTVILIFSFYGFYKVLEHSFDDTFTETEVKNEIHFEELPMEKMATRKKMWDSFIKRHKVRTHRVPDVIGIGVRKCGTGSLRNYLYNHPLMRVHWSEMHYYDENIEKGLRYYIQNLKDATEEEVIMEKTPAYFVTLPYELPQIIRRDSPNVKLILILCDPVNRAFSDYVMRIETLTPKVLGRNFEGYMEEYFDPVKNLFHNMTMEDDKEKFTNVMRILQRQGPLHSFALGIYAFFLRRWMNEFPPSNLLLINGEEFLEHPGIVVEKIQDFIGIPKLLKREDFVTHPETGLFCLRKWWEFDYENKRNWPSRRDWMNNIDCAEKKKGLTRSKTSAYELPRKCAEKLKQFYAPYNKLLFQMIGQDFGWPT